MSRKAEPGMRSAVLTVAAGKLQTVFHSLDSDGSFSADENLVVVAVSAGVRRLRRVATASGYGRRSCECLLRDDAAVRSGRGGHAGVYECADEARVHQLRHRRCERTFAPQRGSAKGITGRND